MKSKIVKVFLLTATALIAVSSCNSTRTGEDASVQTSVSKKLLTRSELLAGIESRSLQSQELGLAIGDMGRQNISLTGVTIRWETFFADWENSNVAGIRIFNTHMSRSALTNANLQGATIRDSGITEAYLEAADLSDADLTDTNFKNSDFSGANLSNARFVMSGLARTNLLLANFDGTDLTEADMREANLSLAKMTNVRNLTQSQLDVACQDPKYGPPEIPENLSWHFRSCERLNRP